MSDLKRMIVNLQKKGIAFKQFGNLIVYPRQNKYMMHIFSREERWYSRKVLTKEELEQFLRETQIVFSKTKKEEDLESLIVSE
ncbi:hypothetical protein [Eubacterium oxidoreducens]|uniref:Uncharacterized protein n=1 Tax=Eubacterium oxidoreducens TaxID=1732 RepID=A0A1G6B3D0_EUBOX|nr:hypothetical protein [Eubacterium oxidoreducens]SDB15049.1 hypothetical protein SAMN02910417_01106 [Eubacterium oxidoreducens]